MSNGPATLPNLILFEDDHLLVINKPAGWNTHAPSPFAGEGVFEWLRHREPRWETLAIIHRLDKETSGVMVFAKSSEANRSLTSQFTAHQITKRYLLATDRVPEWRERTVVSTLSRSGDHYVSQPWRAGADRAETQFRTIEKKGSRVWLEAKPITGRTHQIRVHAAAVGIPILGDVLYGGAPARRVFLHASELTLQHPATRSAMTFAAEPGEGWDSNAVADEPAKAGLRRAIIHPSETTAYRVVHGAADNRPGEYVDRLGEYILVQSAESEIESGFAERFKSAHGVYHKQLKREVRQAQPGKACPKWSGGEAAPDRFEILENGIRFELSFNEGYSVGLFLDQRDNRRRFLNNHIAAGFPLFEQGAAGCEVLNTFAYTCGFSVCAAMAGARVTSLDLSKKYLEWGKRNFTLNGLNAGDHGFIHGDAFDWLRRLAKKGRSFDVVVLDPPTFSQSKETGVFRAEKDYAKLVVAALPVLKPAGVLFASTNAATLGPEDFLEQIDSALRDAGRKKLQQHYVPQPPDFPVSRDEPAYLKTCWTCVG
ncbi:MAG: rRNA (cytosine1962-C5)-methyltransferase [Verrucomicrobiota bacterium]